MRICYTKTRMLLIKNLSAFHLKMGLYPRGHIPLSTFL